MRVHSMLSCDNFQDQVVPIYKNLPMSLSQRKSKGGNFTLSAQLACAEVALRD